MESTMGKAKKKATPPRRKRKTPASKVHHLEAAPHPTADNAIPLSAR
jgi:hypothetical protein